ncbi:hypothetical protein PG990_010631 [Apiospora arundinis]
MGLAKEVNSGVHEVNVIAQAVGEGVGLGARNGLIVAVVGVVGELGSEQRFSLVSWQLDLEATGAAAHDGDVLLVDPALDLVPRSLAGIGGGGLGEERVQLVGAEVLSVESRLGIAASQDVVLVDLAVFLDGNAQRQGIIVGGRANQVPRVGDCSGSLVFDEIICWLRQTGDKTGRQEQ